MLDSDDHPRIPQTIPSISVPDFDYEDLNKSERIGTGGDADVYRATIHNGEYTIAVKEPRFEGTIQSRALEKFRNEAETWERLDEHSNIVTVYSWGTEPLPWLALEYMDGGTVEEKVGSIDIPQALWLTGRIAEGIHYGHRHGVAHLDIKPTNLLLRDTGPDTWDFPKVSDWGLAKMLLEHSNSIEGISPTYAAPEQFDSAKFGNPDDFTDIYQLGAVIYALLTGEPPFSGSSTAVMRSVLDDKPDPPSEINSDVPVAADEIVLKALRKNKQERYDSIVLLREKLDQLFEKYISDDLQKDAKAGASPVDEVSSRSTIESTAKSASGGSKDSDSPSAVSGGVTDDSSSLLTRRRALGIASTGAVGIGLVAVTQSNSNSPDSQRAVVSKDTTTQTDTKTAEKTEGGAGGDSAEPITVGVIQPLSGPFTPWGKSHKAGFAHAIKEINQNGGVLDGRKLQVKTQDTGSDPSKAESAFRKFVKQEDAVAVTGAVSSDVGIKTARTAQDLQVPNFLHMAGSDAVITSETTYTFRVGLLPATTTMEAQAQLVEGKSYTKIGAIVGDYAWGQSVKAAIEENFPVEVNIQVAPVGADDFKPYIRKFDKDIEMLIATGHPPGTFTIIQQTYELGLSPETITGPGFPPGIYYGALGSNITKGATHLHNSDVYSNDYIKVGKDFGKSTGKRFDTHVSYGYVTAKIIAGAIEKAGSADSTAVRDATTSMTLDSLFAQPIQWNNYGELKEQVQLYSQFEEQAPAYYPDGKWRLKEWFRSNPLPALLPEK